MVSAIQANGRKLQTYTSEMERQNFKLNIVAFTILIGAFRKDGMVSKA